MAVAAEALDEAVSSDSGLEDSTQLTMLRRSTQDAREGRLVTPDTLHPRIVVLSPLQPR